MTKQTFLWVVVVGFVIKYTLGSLIYAWTGLDGFTPISEWGSKQDFWVLTDGLMAFFMFLDGAVQVIIFSLLIYGISLLFVVQSRSGGDE